jgi:hypothetical protein
MNLDRMSRRSLPGTGALLTIEKAIGPTSAAQPVDTKEATVLQESLIVPWKLQVSDEALADLRERKIYAIPRPARKRTTSLPFPPPARLFRKTSCPIHHARGSRDARMSSAGV